MYFWDQPSTDLAKRIDHISFWKYPNEIPNLVTTLAKLDGCTLKIKSSVLKTLERHWINVIFLTKCSYNINIWKWKDRYLCQQHGWSVNRFVCFETPLPAPKWHVLHTVVTCFCVQSQLLQTRCRPFPLNRHKTMCCHTTSLSIHLTHYYTFALA